MATEHESREEKEPGLIRETLAFLANFGCRHPWLVVALTLLTCTASLLTSYKGLKFHNHRDDLVSPTKEYYQRWQQYVAEFGDDDDMVVVVQGSPGSDGRRQMELALEDLAQQVAKKPQLFDRLFYKVDLRNLRNRALLFLPTEQIGKVQKKVQNLGPLLSVPVLGDLWDPLFGWKNLTVQNLMLDAGRRVSVARNNPDKADDDLPQFASIMKGAGDFLQDKKSYHNPWLRIIPVQSGPEDYLDKPQYFFCGDGSLATLMVRPMKDEAGGFTFAQKSIDELRAILAETERRFPNVKLGLTGLPVLENDEMIASQHDSNMASWLALLGVAVLYLVVYRGWRYPLMTVATLLIGTAWALGWMTLTVGHLNILSQAFAVMLIGVGDYGVLWVTRFGQERQTRASLPEAIAATAVGVGPGILTAVLTTSLAFFATMLADLKAVAELGWIAGCGVLLCALACFTVLPALITLFDFRFKKNKAAEDGTILSLAEAKRETKQWLPGLTHRPMWVMPVCLGLTLVLGFVALRETYDHNLLHMQARNLDSVRWEEKLIERNPGTSWHALSYTTTPEEALALEEKFKQQPAVSQVICVAQLVPRDQEHKLTQLRDIQERLVRLPERGKIIKHDMPDVSAVLQRARSLCETLQSMEGSQFHQLRESLQHLIASIEAAGDQAGPLLQEYEQAFTIDLVEDLHRLRDASTAAPLQVADLPVSLRERYIGKNGKWLLRIFARESLWDYENLKEFVAGVQAVDGDATGKPFSMLEGLRAMKDSFLLAGLYAFAAMVVVLLLDFGNGKHTLIALAPLMMGLICTLGLMVLCGIALNPANIIAFPLVLGVGANYGVYVLHDYRTRRRGRTYSLSFTTGWGIMVAALAMIMGFGTLMISQHRGLYSLGLVLTLGVTCCMLTALIFLPALLRFVSLRSASREQKVSEAEARERSA